MADSLITVLLVDDNAANLEILQDDLADSGYALVSAWDGVEALEKLTLEPHRYHAVLLDLMMPRMTGMEVLQHMKAHPVLMHVPVIIQTAAASPAEVTEGLAAGAHYYLTKPFEKGDLLAILTTAIRDRSAYLAVQEELENTAGTLQLLHNGTFRFQTLGEARQLATLLAHAYPDPSRVVTGLLELLLNAVEHGNLGITYDEKSRLLDRGQLDEEIARRLQDPAYADRCAVATFIRHGHDLHLSVIDDGAGFDWRPFLHLDPQRAFDTHGRGIATAKMVSFDSLEYHGAGNHVETVVRIPSCGTKADNIAA
ncbi:MAG: response regulator [Nitrospiraceae bacterium]|nr:response regulator [Nitrospiraceae bacterium]